MWHGRIMIWEYYPKQYAIVDQFQSFSMIDLKLNNRASLITCLIIVATIVCTHMIFGLAHLIDYTTTRSTSKITSNLGKNPK